jgi:RimJ/RimL family protein N-acetyltransferase
MFPDLMRDDVFRFETKRLLLRWPRAADAAAIAECAARPDAALTPADVPHPCQQNAERFVLEARAQNAAGVALHLTLMQKAAGRLFVGLVSAQAGPSREVEMLYFFAPHVCEDLAAEAIRAMADTIFNATTATRVFAKSPAKMPLRCLFEKSGLAHVGTASGEAAAEGPCAYERFELDRLAWQRANARRRMPPMMQQRREAAEADAPAAEILIAAAEAVPQC